jgi:hypothetical protein
VSRHNLDITEMGRVRFEFETADMELNFYQPDVLNLGRAVPYWLRHYAKNRQVAGSIPSGVIGIFQ